MRPRKHDGEGASASVRPVGLRELAKHLDLSPTTISFVLNASPGASAIPAETKERVFAAARRFNYRPNFLARSLRAQRTYAVGVMIPEISDGYSALVLSGIEEHLLSAGYMYLVTSHRHQQRLIDHHPGLLFERCVEGIIAVDTALQCELPLPVVSVSGHNCAHGFTNIVLNHDRAAELALAHLVELGHRDIAFFKGQEFSSDTEVRWKAIQRVGRCMGLPLSEELVVQLHGDSPSPEVGYVAAHKLLKRAQPFTALFAFNDVSAIGAVRAFRESGLRVPEDVSVIGMDDVYGAAFYIPALTTIRQPLRKMGALAAEVLLERITGGNQPGFAATLEVEPELVLRESTCRATSNTGRLNL